MNLNELKAQSEVITPLHPELGDVGVTFTVCSPFSREFNAATSRIAPELLKDSDDYARDWEIFQAESLMLDWSGIEDGDEPLAFSPEKCSELFRDPDYHWMVSQLLEHISKKKGYLQTISNRFAHLRK